MTDQGTLEGHGLRTIELLQTHAGHATQRGQAARCAYARDDVPAARLG